MYDFPCAMKHIGSGRASIARIFIFWDIISSVMKAKPVEVTTVYRIGRIIYFGLVSVNSICGLKYSVSI